jgi:hypothetical protein
LMVLRLGSCRLRRQDKSELAQTLLPRPRPAAFCQPSKLYFTPSSSSALKQRAPSSRSRLSKQQAPSSVPFCRKRRARARSQATSVPAAAASQHRAVDFFRAPASNSHQQQQQQQQRLTLTASEFSCHFDLRLFLSLWRWPPFSAISFRASSPLLRLPDRPGRGSSMATTSSFFSDARIIRGL